MRWLLGAAIVALAALPAQSPEQIETGRKIYQDEKCSTCHQIDGQGNRMSPLDDVGSRLSGEAIRRWFTHTEEMENALPRRPAIRMSSRKYSFSDADLDALVAYLKTLK